jgi:hypothetical protein
MDLNVYAAGILAQSRLAELREAADRHHLARTVRRPRPLRWTLGQALVRLGTRLSSSPAPARASA